MTHSVREDARPDSSRAGTRKNFVVALVALCVLVIAGVGFFAYLSGWRAHYLTTPSMGTELPVGSLAVTKPSSISDIEVGDYVTTDTGNGTKRTHAVIGTRNDEQPGLTTQGILNRSPDALPTTQENLVGVVVWSAPVLGWVVQMVPWIAGGWLVMWLASARNDDPMSRRRYRSLGAYLGLALAIIVVQPLLNIHLQSINVRHVADSAYAEANVVSTGLLPINVHPDDEHGEASGRLEKSGVDGQAIDSRADENGYFRFHPKPDLTWPWWLGIGGVVLSPFAFYYLQYRRHRDGDAEELEAIENEGQEAYQ